MVMQTMKLETSPATMVFIIFCLLGSRQVTSAIATNRQARLGSRHPESVEKRRTSSNAMKLRMAMPRWLLRHGRGQAWGLQAPQNASQNAPACF